MNSPDPINVFVQKNVEREKKDVGIGRLPMLVRSAESKEKNIRKSIESILMLE